MHGVDLPGLIAVLAVYAMGSALPTLFPRIPVPGLVFEILGGALLGPQIFGLIGTGPVITFLADYGLAILFLMAGFEVDPAVLRGKPLRLAGAGWLMSTMIAAALMLGLAAAGVIQAPILTALAVCTTAIGALLPVLRDSGQLNLPYGPAILAIGAVGESAPIVALALVVAGDVGRGLQAFLLVGFAIVAVLSVVYAARLSTGPFAAVVERTMGTSGQLPLRLMLMLAIALVLVSEGLGIDGVLGAFLAGSIARASLPHHLRAALAPRLEGVGYGFAVPIFFINAGAHLDLTALVQRPAALALIPIFALAMLAVRGIPALVLYRPMLNAPERRVLALYSSTQLPLVVAIAAMGVRSGAMQGWQGAALVGGGLVSLVLYPMLARALTLRRQRKSTDLVST